LCHAGVDPELVGVCVWRGRESKHANGIRARRSLVMVLCWWYLTPLGSTYCCRCLYTNYWTVLFIIMWANYITQGVAICRRPPISLEEDSLWRLRYCIKRLGIPFSSQSTGTVLNQSSSTRTERSPTALESSKHRPEDPVV
jgi:hypothetical protein